jgi:hypothetical protein
MRVVVLVAVVLLAGCGGAETTTPRPPTIPRALAQSLRAQSDGVAAALHAGDGCLAQQRAVALQTSVIKAVNRHRLAPRFQETLVGSVNDLVSRITCVPPPAPAPRSEPHAHPHPKPHAHPHPKPHAHHGKKHK